MKKFLPIFFLVLLLVPFLALAQTVNPCSTAAVPQGGSAAQALPRCINQIYVWALGISALLAMLMLIIGGYYYMTASGNAERSSRGVEIIWSAVIGLVLLFGAYLLLNTINPDLVRFPTNSFDCLDPANKDLPACQTTTPSGGVRQP